MSCASLASRELSSSSSQQGPPRRHDEDGSPGGAHLPLPAPRSSSYMLMLNSFASDLDSILSDLSTSPPLRGSQDLAGLAGPAPEDTTDGSRHVSASCPNLPGIEASASKTTGTNDEEEEIGLLERIIRSHPVWYLPNVQRLNAAQLLQDEEEGVFITRQSSQPGTLALSVKLNLPTPSSDPTGGMTSMIGPGVQHYLIEAAENQKGVRLESSDFVFDNLPALLAHYCQCCDELPVRLTLPARIRDCPSRSSLTSLVLLGQEFWNRGENILTIPSKRTPPVPPLRLSTFDPLGGASVFAQQQQQPPPSTPSVEPPSTPSVEPPPLPTPTPVERKSPRLEARGTEPTPPPPPPRWCKPQLVLSSSAPDALPAVHPPPPPPPMLPAETEAKETAAGREKRPVMRRKRRRQARRSRPASAQPPESPHCHHSSLADKASDYEDIWNTSPGDDDDDDEGEDAAGGGGAEPSDVVLIRLASVEDTANLSEPSERRKSSASSASSTTSSADEYKATTPASSDGAIRSGGASPVSRSLTSSPERPPPAESLPEATDVEQIEPPESIQEESCKAKRKSITIVEIRHDSPEDKENIPEEKAPEQSQSVPLELTESAPAIRRRSSNSSNDGSRRTSPLYSEPADALPPSQQHQTAWMKNSVGGTRRPLPPPPPPSVPPPASTTTTMDFQTFTKDGYVRCTLPALSAKPPSQPPKVSSLPPMSSGKGKQVSLPKPPRQLPRSFASASLPSPASHAPPPSVFYLPTATEDNSLTIQEVLTALYPTAALTDPPSRTPTPPGPVVGATKARVSAYDNLLSGSAGDLDEEDEEDVMAGGTGGDCGPDEDELSDDGTVTEFSEPWDSARWDRLLLSSSPAGSLPRPSKPPAGSNGSGTPSRRKKLSAALLNAATTATAPMSSTGSADGDGGTASLVVTGRPPPVPPQLLRTRSFKDKMDPLLAAPRLLALRSACNSQAGKNLQVLVIQLGRDCTTTFGRSLQNFLQCTREAKEQRAAPVLRNVRQFISGIKNFLGQHGEPAFDSALLDIRSKLKPNEFLNVDAVLEVVLHQLVTLPLRSHLYKLLGQEAMAAGSVQQLVAGIRLAREVHPSSLGLKEGQPAPSEEVLAKASASLDRLQKAASPLDKLEELLDACAAIYNHAAEACGDAVAAEDFLPLLAWLLARSGFSTAEMEADFMWALLQPSLLAGEGGYFLTALSSAAQLLKNLQSRPASPSDAGSWMGTLTSIPECSTGAPQQPCVLRVLVADENASSLLARTVPLRPSMTVRDVTKLLALKLRLSNPQDFTLVALMDGQEIQLPETENPQAWMASHGTANFAGQPLVKGSACTFAFRRQDAKIAWPRQINA